MATKFSFYLPTPSMDAETHKEAKKTAEEVDTVGETVETSFSASTFEDGGQSAKHPIREAVEEDAFDDEEVVANDEEAGEDEEAGADESPSVVAEAVSEETATDSEVSQKSSEYEEEDNVEEEEGTEEEAYVSCAEEEEEENGKQEGSTVSKGDAKAAHHNHSVPQSNSYMSEVTYESHAPSVAACSTASASEDVQEFRRVSHNLSTMPPESATVSHRLASMMLERIQAMDNIRTLLKNERDQEKGLRAEFTAKVRVLEDDLVAKDENLAELRTKNADYARQLGRLSSTINELVDSNHANIAQMSQLEQDVASKTEMMKEMNKEILDQQSALDKKTDENASLVKELKTFKAENEELKGTIEDLQAKNTDYANELENLMSSLHELVEQNTALEGQVEELIEANKMLESVLIPTKEKNTELLDTVDGLTETLEAANSTHKKEVEELQEEMKATRQQMKEEQDSNATTVQQLEKILEDTTAQMTGQLSAQKDGFEKQVAGLARSLEEAKSSCKKKSKRNEKLQKEIEDIGRAAAKNAENAAGTISQLEKDLEEEFQITTQLKRGMEDLKKKAQQEEDDKYTDDLEDLLSSLRMIQCWQLSHFQRINKLVSENKDQARSIQLLS